MYCTIIAYLYLYLIYVLYYISIKQSNLPLDDVTNLSSINKPRLLNIQRVIQVAGPGVSSKVHPEMAIVLLRLVLIVVTA